MLAVRAGCACWLCRLLSLAFVPSLYNTKTGITLKSGQRMLFLLFLQDSYSQYPLFYFTAAFTSRLTGASVCSTGDLWSWPLNGP